ncbi:MAG: xanthine dehydrogenase family protein subunit M [Hyphomicrobiales bacterium]|nr:xanthine dehydrogenase family protein subunit M [Hyphomicrobiales bacterium]MCP5074215.1 xanthine dehydrogenase family protein subunit M [Paracoccaceae bacterium]
MLPAFELSQPKTLPEALKVLAAGRGLPLAGGTVLFPDLRGGKEKGREFIDLSGIDELRYITHEAKRITVGARTTIAEILRDPAMAGAAPALHKAVDNFAGTMVRNAATVGGNLCCGSPSADTVPALLTLDAEVELTRASGSRTVPLDGYYLDYKKTVKKPDELLTSVFWAPAEPGSAHLFFKLARRKGDAVTVTGVSVMIAKTDGKCSTARIALSSVAPTVFRAHSAEEMLKGQKLTPDLIERAAQAATDQSSPIDDNRSSANYRRLTTQALVCRLLSQAWHQAS